MNIVLAVHHFPPHYTGGAEWETFNTAQALQARGHHVRVLCVEKIDSGPQGSVKAVDDTFRGVPVRRLFFNVMHAPDRQRLEFDNTWIGDYVRTWWQEDPPDVMHLLGGYLLSGRLLRVANEVGARSVVSLMDFWFLCRRMSLWRTDGTLSTLPIDPVRCARCVGEERRLWRWLGQTASPLAEAWWRTQTGPITVLRQRQAFLRETLNQTQAIICRSQFVRGTFVQAGIAPERLRFIRQGRDFPHLATADLSKPPSERLRITYLGQIAELKGVHTILEAARRLPHAPLQVKVFGNASAFPTYTARLQKIIGADPRLQLAGTYSTPAELTAILRESDVVVVSSLWYENSPNVILEALAHRTPVVACRLGGMAELVEDRVNGLHFTPGDPADLARAWQRLLDEPGLLARLQAGTRPPKSLAEEMDELTAVYTGA